MDANTDRAREERNELYRKAVELYRAEGRTPASMNAVSAWWAAYKRDKGIK